jgi:hypothetical protein
MPYIVSPSWKDRFGASGDVGHLVDLAASDLLERVAEDLASGSASVAA